MMQSVVLIVSLLTASLLNQMQVPNTIATDCSSNSEETQDVANSILEEDKVLSALRVAKLRRSEKKDVIPGYPLCFRISDNEMEISSDKATKSALLNERLSARDYLIIMLGLAMVQDGVSEDSVMAKSNLLMSSKRVIAKSARVRSAMSDINLK